jgi:hypothetical protein
MQARVLGSVPCSSANNFESEKPPYGVRDESYTPLVCGEVPVDHGSTLEIALAEVFHAPQL